MHPKKIKQSRKVYFIQQITPGHLSTDGPVKIGISKNVTRRKKELQQSCAHDLEVLKTFEPGKPTEAEMWLHDRFWNLHMRGEWFHSNPRILNFEPEHDDHGKCEPEGHIAESLLRRNYDVKLCIDGWGIGNKRLMIKRPDGSRKQTLFYNPDTGRICRPAGARGGSTIYSAKDFHELIMFMRRNGYSHTESSALGGI